MHRLYGLLACAALAFAPMPVWAWGKTGHRVVGAIATQYLTPNARKAVIAVLGNETLAEAANWPDFMRSNPDLFWQKTAAPWHYVTVPRGKTYEEVGAPPEGDGVTALARFAQTLQRQDAPLEDKKLALRFIVHIVGDLHQPLHARLDTDRGGHDVAVTFFDTPTDLHVVWDEAIIDQQQLSYTEWTDLLLGRIMPEQARQWSTADLPTWIRESVALRDTIYPDGAVLSYDYVYRHRAEVELRLEQAGLRLAAFLNRVFDGKH